MSFAQYAARNVYKPFTEKQTTTATTILQSRANQHVVNQIIHSIKLTSRTELKLRQPPKQHQICYYSTEGSAQADPKIEPKVEDPRIRDIRIRELLQEERKEREKKMREKNSQIGKLLLAVLLIVLGGSYGAVPLYRIFCSATGYGGTVRKAPVASLSEKPIRYDRPLTIYFMTEPNSSIPWQFAPLQNRLQVFPGESVLALYNATNSTDESIVGVATYNVLPQKAGYYFNKVKCFCFDEQKLDGKESIDMPVLFFIDPEFCDDPDMEDVKDITLSYTFFRAEDYYGE